MHTYTQVFSVSSSVSPQIVQSDPYPFPWLIKHKYGSLHTYKNLPEAVHDVLKQKGVHLFETEYFD